MAELTPMMQQYMETKKEYKDCILFYRLGDFYEMFFDDALTASKELEITLTGKNCGLEERAPMCGVPYHAVDSYLSRLVEKGYKVAICEQVEDPKQAKGIVKREVIRIVTPGTNIDSMTMDETKNQYIMSIVFDAGRYGVSIADVSTGDYFVTETDSATKLFDEIYKLIPNKIDSHFWIFKENDTHFFMFFIGFFILVRHKSKMKFLISQVIFLHPVPQPGQFQCKITITVAKINKNKTSVFRFFSSDFVQSQGFLVKL